MKALQLITIGLFLFALAGCGEKAPSAQEDQDLRNNFSRPLNDEEMAQMGKSDPPAPPQKGN